MFRKLSYKTKSPKPNFKPKSKTKLNNAFLAGQFGSSQSFSTENSNEKNKSKDTNTPQNETARFLASLKDPEVIERVRVTIKQAHVFKLPTRQTVSLGWRGAEWKDKVWQGKVKVVERGGVTAVLLVDEAKDTIFAVCPLGGTGDRDILEKGAVDRCVDSSRYFVLRIQNENGRNMFIGVAFNERSDAFDFNAALEDSKRERRNDWDAASGFANGNGKNSAFSGLGKDYSLKDGEKIRVAIPKDRAGFVHQIKSNHTVSRRLGENMKSSRGVGTQAFDDFYQQENSLTEDEDEDDDAFSPSGSPSSSHVIKTGGNASKIEQNQHDELLGGISSSMKRGIDEGSVTKPKIGFLKPSSKDTPSRSRRER